MKWWLTRFAVALTFSLALVGLSACGPEGQPCGRAGSTKTVANEHKTYHCKYNPASGGNTWQ